MRALITLSLLPLVACSTSVLEPSAVSSARSTRTGAVVDGQASTQNEIGATVALLDPNSDDFFCTGTLVAPRVVVTAAHCVRFGVTLSPGEVLVVEDELDATNPPNNSRLEVAEVIPHPEYGGGNFGGDPDGLTDDRDIAVLVLAEDASVPPSPILSIDDLDATLSQGELLLVQGYGLTSLQSNNAGQLFHAETPFQRHTAGELLAGGPGTPDTCNGDSGGPAYFVDGDTRILVGVTSRAATSSQQACGDGGIYTLAPAFDAWIEEVSGGLYVGAGTEVILPPSEQEPVTGSCSGSCGFLIASGECACDPVCEQMGDCCPDFEARCPAQAEGWECAVDTYGDGNCDCGCGGPDVDCAADACAGELPDTPVQTPPVAQTPPDAPALDDEPKPVDDQVLTPAGGPTITQPNITQDCSQGGVPTPLAALALSLLALIRRRARIS